MKKIYLLFIALALVAFSKTTQAQAVTTTIQVDMTNFITGGGTVNLSGMRVGGTFATDSASANGSKMLNWTPSDTAGRMTDLGNNIWSIDVTFASAVVGVGDTLQFKFVNGNWSGTTGCTACTNEDANSDHSLVNSGCSPATGAAADNRLFPIPVTSGLTYRWCYDSCKQCNGVAAGVLQVDKKVAFFSLAPNPTVNKQSTLMYTVSQNSPVNISVYNVLGQVVKTFVNTTRPAGLYNQTIDLNEFTTGVYFIQLTSGNQSVSKKIVLE